MSEYVGAKNFVKRINEVYEANKDGKYDFTVLLTSFLGVLELIRVDLESTSNEKNKGSYKEIYNKPIEEKSSEIPKVLKNELEKGSECNNYGDYWLKGLDEKLAVYGDLIRHLRNSLSHARFESCNEDGIWVGVKLSDENNSGNETMQMKLSKEDVLRLYKEILRLALEDLPNDAISSKEED